MQQSFRGALPRRPGRQGLQIRTFWLRVVIVIVKRELRSRSSYWNAEKGCWCGVELIYVRIIGRFYVEGEEGEKQNVLNGGGGDIRALNTFSFRFYKRTQNYIFHGGNALAMSLPLSQSFSQPSWISTPILPFPHHQMHALSSSIFAPATVRRLLYTILLFSELKDATADVVHSSTLPTTTTNTTTPALLPPPPPSTLKLVFLSKINLSA